MSTVRSSSRGSLKEGVRRMVRGLQVAAIVVSDWGFLLAETGRLYQFVGVRCG